MAARKSVFVAVDVETANADMASICQIGLAVFSNGRLVDEWCSLVNPEYHFDGANIGVHGITPNDVASAPTFPEVTATVAKFMAGNVCVSHTHFDRVSFERSFARYRLEPIDARWLDSAKVARRAWEDCARRGYGLAELCRRIGYEFQHHDALEDAKAAGHVLLAAMAETGHDLDVWLKRVNRPIAGRRRMHEEETRQAGASRGPLAGEVVVFTGFLSISRTEAARLATRAGCAVAPSVTRKTTVLVVGDQDLSKLAGQEKSSKHRKAEQMIAEGHPIRILKESDFFAFADFNAIPIE